MKVDVVQKDKEFEPITLTITIESRDELNSLIARLAIAHDVVNCELNSYPYTIDIKHRATSGSTINLFHALYNLK